MCILFWEWGKWANMVFGLKFNGPGAKSLWWVFYFFQNRYLASGRTSFASYNHFKERGQWLVLRSLKSSEEFLSKERKKKERGSWIRRSDGKWSKKSFPLAPSPSHKYECHTSLWGPMYTSNFGHGSRSCWQRYSTEHTIPLTYL